MNMRYQLNNTSQTNLQKAKEAEQRVVMLQNKLDSLQAAYLSGVREGRLSSGNISPNIVNGDQKSANKYDINDQKTWIGN